MGNDASKYTSADVRARLENTPVSDDRWNHMVKFSNGLIDEVDDTIIPRVLFYERETVAIDDLYLMEPTSWVTKTPGNALRAIVSESTPLVYKLFGGRGFHMLFKDPVPLDIRSEEDIVGAINNGYDIEDLQTRLTLPWVKIREATLTPWTMPAKEVAISNEIVNTMYPGWRFRNHRLIIDRLFKNHPEWAERFDKKKVLDGLFEKRLIGTWSQDMLGFDIDTEDFITYSIIAAYILVWLASQEWSSKIPMPPRAAASNTTDDIPSAVPESIPWDWTVILKGMGDAWTSYIVPLGGFVFARFKDPLSLLVIVLLRQFSKRGLFGGGGGADDDSLANAHEWLRLIFAKFGSLAPVTDSLWKYLRAWADDTSPDALTSAQVKKDLRESIVPELARRVKGTVTPREGARLYFAERGERADDAVASSSASSASSSLFWRRPARRVRFEVPE